MMMCQHFKTLKCVNASKNANINIINRGFVLFKMKLCSYAKDNAKSKR